MCEVAKLASHRPAASSVALASFAGLTSLGVFSLLS